MVNFVNFPAVTNANEDGLLAMGGDLSVDSLVSAYAQGIFPWFNDDQPILWWSPNPRLVLYPDQVKISRSLRKTIRKGLYRVSCNTQFERVIKGCALRGSTQPHAPAPDTWITDSMHSAYLDLHRLGYAHSIEVWQENTLVGGLYGVALGSVFFGESMFSSATDASKIALVSLCQWLRHRNVSLIDCQVASDHLLSLGAKEITRSAFLKSLEHIDIESPHTDFAVDFEQLSLKNAINVNNSSVKILSHKTEFKRP